MLPHSWHGEPRPEPEPAVSCRSASHSSATWSRSRDEGAQLVGSSERSPEELQPAPPWVLSWSRLSGGTVYSSRSRRSPRCSPSQRLQEVPYRDSHGQRRQRGRPSFTATCRC